MLRINQNTQAAGAKSYYSTADYYSEGQELTGHWRGEAARRLGLQGDVKQADWDALCEEVDARLGTRDTLHDAHHVAQSQSEDAVVPATQSKSPLYRPVPTGPTLAAAAVRTRR